MSHSDPTRKEAAARIKTAIRDAQWAMLTKEEAQAIATAAIIEIYEK